MFYDNYWLDINKRVDQLLWSYSILTKVFSSRLGNATALDTCLVVFGSRLGNATALDTCLVMHG